MKKAIYSLVLAAGIAGGFSSCGDFLEIKPQNEVLFEDFWNEKADVYSVVTGCYAGLQDNDVVSRMMIWGEFRSDNVTVGTNISGDGNLENILKENLRSSNSYTTWDPLYKVINRCNTVIKYAPMVAERDISFSEGDLRATIAEVSAIRDLCYFYLIRTFRNVPYSTIAYTDDDQKFDLPATPFYNVLDSLILDLESVKGDAVIKYPENKENYQTGRITREAIYAMLCEMYLWKKDYAKCIEYADLVIESKIQTEEEERLKSTSTTMNVAEYLNGYPLIPSKVGLTGSEYGGAYDEIFGQGNSKEGIFELTYDKENDNMRANSSIDKFYGNTTGGGLLKPASFIAEDVTTKMYKVFNNKLDARYYENIDASEPVIMKGVARTASIEAQNADNIRNTASMYAKGKNKSNFIFYRLSDIMLLKAEALVQQMGTDTNNDSIATVNKELIRQAFALVNVINKRSMCQSPLKDTLTLSSYTTKSQMEELVLLERQRELMFEGKRWYDLVRDAMRKNDTSILISHALQKYSSNTSVIQNKLLKLDAIFWPIHEDELKINKNLKQNPVYGASEDKNHDLNLKK